MATTLFVLLIIFLLLNVPLAISVAFASIVALLVADMNGFIAVQRMVTGLDTFSLMAIPLFMIAGKIMEKGGISKRLIDLAASMVGSLTGGFAIVAVLATMFFSAISGSGPATVVAIGSIMVPAMVKAGYDLRFSLALIASAGTIGVIIPPSIPFITYGITANVSIGDLFLAGIFPGIIMGISLMIYSYFVSKKRGYKGGEKFSFPVLVQRFKEAFLGLLMPFIILGGIYGGIFTPTESGAVACVYGLIISLFVYRSMKVSDLKATFNEAGLLSAMVLFIIGTANLMSWILTTEQVPAKVSSIVGDFTGSQLVLLLIIAAIFLFVGTFLELNAAIILLVPILLPILGAFDVDLIHFGIIMVVNLAIGLLTPPLGVNLFVAKSLADVSFNSIVKAAIPFLIVLIINLLLFILIPQISTALL
ncbi:TRAP transporter large permease [Halalkalibacter nanhaiisediminis]|uniref:C4-dicarboxylate transporter DctM subunit n=1 Tax=Halalkalibacter nanhaiisediminis TaxID=688079 RepID=A0A562QMW5_9BACI|nr:TRAP transporter large permease [Halalkalibacter nanhaiisediminis]TWI58079.1 C4-dicarboxylate transporter DctM subunit [Halalkalibacter nanhaiisediminis]